MCLDAYCFALNGGRACCSYLLVATIGLSPHSVECSLMSTLGDDVRLRFGTFMFSTKRLESEVKRWRKTFDA